MVNVSKVMELANAARGAVGRVDAEVGEGRLVVKVQRTGQIYEIPQGGLYKYCWHPHYFMEWIEWTGFLIATGPSPPVINFLVNEIAAMTPRAFQGLIWYREKFGRKLPQRKAVIPFLL